MEIRDIGLGLLKSIKNGNSSWDIHFNHLPDFIKRILTDINHLVIKKTLNFCENICLNFHTLLKNDHFQGDYEELEYSQELNNWFFSTKKKLKIFFKNFDEIELEISTLLNNEEKKAEIEEKMKNLRKSKLNKDFMVKNFNFDFEKSTLNSRFNSILKTIIGKSDYNEMGLITSNNTTFKVILKLTLEYFRGIRG